MSEYEHAMGNSSGDFWSYWNQIYEKPYLQGGFIASWVDSGLAHSGNGNYRQGITAKARLVQQSILGAFGGDFGPPDTPSDEQFLLRRSRHAGPSSTLRGSSR